MEKQNKRGYSIIIRKKAEKKFLKIPLLWQEKITKAIEFLKDDPFYGEKMWGEFANSRKIRVWPYRIIYDVYKDKKIIYIRRIDHRGSIGYK